MNPATAPPARRDSARLLVIDPVANVTEDGSIVDLPSLLAPGDLLVVNDAATLPASLGGRFDSTPIELRLLAHRGGSRWSAVLFGPGSWRDPTEHRPAPPVVRPGARLELGDDLGATVRDVSRHSPRLLEIELCSTGDVLERVYALGRPIQYSYLRDELALWSVQTPYASRPWAVEMPSAGRPLSVSILNAARRRGIEIARVTHAAGLSNTGDPTIDELLPLPERFDIPARTVRAVELTRKRQGRVVAVGTTVVRALEGCAQLQPPGGPPLVAGVGETSLRIDHHHRLRVVDGLLTGMHDPSASHFSLLTAFADTRILLAGWSHAVANGYQCHEFGDSTLMLPSRY